MEELKQKKHVLPRSILIGLVHDAGKVLCIGNASHTQLKVQEIQPGVIAHVWRCESVHML